MKNRDILSWKLKAILEKEPILGQFLEDMCFKVYYVKQQNLITNKDVIRELLKNLMKDFEMMGIEEDKNIINYNTNRKVN